MEEIKETLALPIETPKETFENIISLFTDNGYELEQVILINKTVNNNIIATLFGTIKEGEVSITNTIHILITKTGISATDDISRFDKTFADIKDGVEDIEKLEETGLFLTNKAGLKVDVLTHLCALFKLLDFNQNYVRTDDYDFRSDKHKIVPYDSLEYTVIEDVLEELSEILSFTSVEQKRTIVLSDTPLPTGLDENGKAYRYQIITNDGETVGTPLETIESAKAWCLDLANNDEMMQELCPDTDIETISFITIVETTDY